MSRYLSILEVSQKQSYIFSSNKMKENIQRSDNIAEVLSAEFIMNSLKELGYSDENNMVYAGGGHTILSFDSKEMAVECIKKLTQQIYTDKDGLSVFAKTIEYDAAKTVAENLEELSKQLEIKKSIRASAFRQGTYGIEKIDTVTYKPVQAESHASSDNYSSSNDFTPSGFNTAMKFDNLGGIKNESSFIAVVHVDGNGMGKRVKDLYEIPAMKNADFDSDKKILRRFSEGIDADFKAAYKQMCDVVADNLTESKKVQLGIKGNYFPIRKIILAGDDVCFVTTGKLGIECAKIFIEELNKKKNEVDNKGYAACAGVALVHQKYPFYKAYELAEMLCSNAKAFGAQISKEDNGSCISSIDWHIEFGELEDSLSDIRRNYLTNDNNTLEMRPYIIGYPDSMKSKITNEYNARMYDSFRRVILNVLRKESGYPKGKIKELRNALKGGESETKYYLTYNRMNDILIESSGKEKIDLSELFSGKKEEYNSFIELPGDAKKHSILFDAIEVLDTFEAINRRGN